MADWRPVVFILGNRKLGANAIKRVAAGAHLPTPRLFGSAKLPDDRADYCFVFVLEADLPRTGFLQNSQIFQFPQSLPVRRGVPRISRATNTCEVYLTIPPVPLDSPLQVWGPPRRTHN